MTSKDPFKPQLLYDSMILSVRKRELGELRRVKAGETALLICFCMVHLKSQLVH